MKCEVVSSNHLITNVLLKSFWVVVWNFVGNLSYVKKHSSEWNLVGNLSYVKETFKWF